MISLIIPTTSANANYTDSLLKNISDLYGTDKGVEVIVEISDSVNLCRNYNNAVERAKGEKIILLHNDMILKPGFVETLDRDIRKNRITSYTRIEPPIFNDTYPGKVILDCGDSLETFNREKFNAFHIGSNLIDGGSQLFFGCRKEDFIGLDDKTFNPPAMWCSDDDIHLRYKLLGFEHKVSSAHVYHFVSKTSRADNSYKGVEQQSVKNFIRKWGHFGKKEGYIPPKYDVGIVLETGLVHVEYLEPWCSKIYLNDPYELVILEYIKHFQKETAYDLSQRVINLAHNNNKVGSHDITVYIKDFNQEDFANLQMLSEIVQSTDETGMFELGNMKILITGRNELQSNLIHL